MSSPRQADPFAKFKAAQKEGWAHFQPLAAVTTPTAAKLVNFAGVKAGQQVLDVACGTGVVAVTCAMRGASVTGLDLTPELLTAARESSAIAGVKIDFHEGDAEQLPFPDAEFDVVLSQFGHIFAPRPDVALGEMLRVLRPGGTIAFSTWPPEHFTGRSQALTARYLPPPPPGAVLPTLWGDEKIVRERLGDRVREISFARDYLYNVALSAAHMRVMMESSSGQMLRIVQELSKSDPSRLAQYRQEYESLVAEYLKDNQVHQQFLMTRAIKK
jgi:ubiquinone/menaquinone biosynthesis C-methylase UbiE